LLLLIHEKIFRSYKSDDNLNWKTAKIFLPTKKNRVSKERNTDEENVVIRKDNFLNK
jgi:hypothetical protein